MIKVHTESGYDFYIESGCGNTTDIFNIVPENSPAPIGGYPNRRWIEKIKGVKFPDRYQPTKYGCRETWCSDE